MPNYDTRKARASDARNEAEALRKNGRNTHTQPLITALVMEAAALEEMNERMNPVKYHADANGDDNPGHVRSDVMRELEGYHDDYMKHKQDYERTQSAESKQHMLMELNQFVEWYVKLYETLLRSAKAADERQCLQAIVQRIAQVR